jgi:cobalt-zinc-cadmium efflux system membrane fusion protein
MKNRTIFIVVLSTTCFFTACKQNSEQKPKEEEEHEHAADHPDDVHLVENQMKAMDIQLGKVRELNLSTTVKSSGQLELPPQNKASVSALMGGRIKSIQVVPGDRVQKGQVLAYLENPIFIDLQQKYLSLQREVIYLESDFKRKEKLVKDGAVSQQEYDKANAAYFSTLPNLRAVEEKLRMLDVNIGYLNEGKIIGQVPVKSPIRGYVRLIETNIGKYMAPEEEMFEIVDNDHIHIDLRIYEKDLHLVKEGQKVIFTLTNRPLEVMEGKVFAVGKAFENKERAMMIHAEITEKNKDLIPGMYVDARIITDNKKVEALPNDAIVSDAGLNYIFVLKPREEQGHEDEFVFRKIEVNLGASDIGFTEVIPTYNLPDHAQIVVQGAFYLLAEMKKGEGGHGHHH